MDDLRKFVLPRMVRCLVKPCLADFSGSFLVLPLLVLVLLSACATDNSPTLRGNGSLAESRLLPSAASPVTTARYPGTQAPVDEKSRRVAIDMVSALRQVFRERTLADEISVARPANAFEYNLIEQLQLSGFSIFLATDDNPDALLSYSVELVSGGVDSAVDLQGKVLANSPLLDSSVIIPGSFNDYAFSLKFEDFVLLRQYRVSEQAVHPVTPMLLFGDSSTGNSKVVLTDDSIFTASSKS